MKKIITIMYVWGILFFPTQLAAQDFSEEFTWGIEPVQLNSGITEFDTYSDIFENTLTPPSDSNFLVEDFEFVGKEEIVLKELAITPGQLEDGCPQCTVGTLSADASGRVTCSDPDCKFNTLGAYLITGSPVGDSLLTFAFAALLYMGIITSRILRSRRATLAAAKVSA